MNSMKGFNSLSNDMLSRCKDLAILASKGELSLFIGAGVSIGAGCPSWFQLLGIIEDAFTPTGSESERKIGNKVNWDALTFADALEEVCKTETDRSGLQKSLKERIAIIVDRPFPSLLMTLLASLPTEGTITQNYDRGAEMAYNNLNLVEHNINNKHQLSVIPYNPMKGANTWLLKMHGCVTSIDDIVITSADFARFEKNKQALGGLVQANLLTSHMLFVGFSMTDMNYLRIIEEVRDALKPSNQTKVVASGDLQGSRSKPNITGKFKTIN